MLKQGLKVIAFAVLSLCVIAGLCACGAKETKGLAGVSGQYIEGTPNPGEGHLVEGNTPEEGTAVVFAPAGDAVSDDGSINSSGSRQNMDNTVESLISENNRVDPEIIYNGELYGRRKNVSAYLIMGIDKEGEAGKQSIDDTNGRNDANVLIVIDDDAKTYTCLQISRDIVVPVDAVTYYGDYMASFSMRLCMAHFYGDGAEVSAQNVVNSVSKFLGGISIDGYAAVKIAGVSAANDALGGVSVLITDDFSNTDKTLVRGETVLLLGEHAECFVSARTSVGDGSGEGRNRRQRDYLDAYLSKFKSEFGKHSDVVNSVYNAAKPYMVSDMSLGLMSDLAAKTLSYTSLGIITVPEAYSNPMQDADGASYTESYADIEKLSEMVISLFYEKA